MNLKVDFHGKDLKNLKFFTHQLSQPKDLTKTLERVKIETNQYLTSLIDSQLRQKNGNIEHLHIL
jgi:hypothetical protein